VTQPPGPPPGQYPPNPYAQYQVPRPSWTVPVVAGAIATVALHSWVLINPDWWLPACCFVCVTGIPVGFVPAVLATRRDPWMGAGSGFAVAFLAVGLGATALAIAAFAQGFQVSGKTLDLIEQQLRKDPSHTDADVANAIQALQQAGPFIPVVAAGLLSLTGGVAGAIVAALAGRRARYPWPPAGPYQGQPPA
jgi:hypothetical protein